MMFVECTTKHCSTGRHRLGGLSCAGRADTCVRADLSACLSYQGKPTRNRNRFGECERQPQQLIHWTHARTAAPPPQSIPTQDLQCSLLQACDRHFAQGDPDSLGRCRAELRCITRTLCHVPMWSTSLASYADRKTSRVRLSAHG